MLALSVQILQVVKINTFLGAHVALVCLLFLLEGINESSILISPPDRGQSWTLSNWEEEGEEFSMDIFHMAPADLL